MLGDRHAGEINSASHPSAVFGCCAGGEPLFVEQVSCLGFCSASVIIIELGCSDETRAGFDTIIGIDGRLVSLLRRLRLMSFLGTDGRYIVHQWTYLLAASPQYEVVL
jgi:hypothetical protein